jgi:type II secretory pathway pseudopilin PulG
MKRPRPKTDAGFAIATLIVFAAVVSILAAATIPAYQMRAQREREEELIFRGEEYVRAIQKYQRKYNVYPPTLDALLNTDGIRFVRRQYKDPITGEDFRIISVNPDGSVVGSNTLNLAAGTPLNLGNNAQGQRSGANGPTIVNTGGGAVGTGGVGGQVGAGTSGLLGAGGGTNAGNRGGLGTVGTGGTGGIGGNAAGSLFPGTQRGAAGNTGGINPAGGTGNRPGTGLTNQTGLGNPTSASSGIIGVGANKPEESIKVYQTHQKYSEWEFTVFNVNPQGQNGQNPNGQNGQNGQNPQNGQNGINPGAAGNRGQTNSPFGQSTNPIGQPGNNPFVPGGGNGANPLQPGQPLNRGR